MIGRRSSRKAPNSVKLSTVPAGVSQAE